MHPVTRRGFTLIELMVALVLLGLVTAAIYRVLVSNQRLYNTQTQMVGLQQNIRAAGTILPAEFREIAASEGDIYQMTATDIRMRAMRQFGVMCREPVLGGALGGLTMTLYTGLFNGAPLAVGDSLLLFYDGDEGSRLDDVWWPAIVKTAPAGGVCPDGAAGTTVLIDLGPATLTMLNKLGGIPRGAPMRAFKAVRYALYQAADGLYYLGLEIPLGATIQPLIGPLSGADGLSLEYYDATGTVTAVPANVALIEIRVRGRTAAPVHGSTSPGLTIPVDSLVTRVALRNNRRF